MRRKRKLSTYTQRKVASKKTFLALIRVIRPHVEHEGRHRLVVDQVHAVPDVFLEPEKKVRLPSLEFVPSNEPGSFGFIDPDLIVRGSHLMPAFSQGVIPTLFVSTGESAGDEYRCYYVNM